MLIKSFKHYLLLLGLCLSETVLAAMTMPAPPPELPDTLLSFRTREQQQELEIIEAEQQAVDQVEEVEDELPLSVPGDEATGVLRSSLLYVPGQAVGVPDYGSAIMRFYDLQGVPWDIDTVKVEHQGFMAEITASPSELLIRQQPGAATGTLAVNLAGYASPLVFTLRPVAMENRGRRITTSLNFVKVQSYLNAEGYVFPTILKVPEPMPGASPMIFDDLDHEELASILIEAVRQLKESDNGKNP